METVLDAFFSSAKRYSLSQGQLLLTPDETPRGVYYIRSGYVKAYDISSSGTYQILSINGPGDFLPLFWALGGDDNPWFYETMCRTEFSIMSKDDFHAALQGNEPALWSVIAYLIKSYRFSQQRIQNLEYLSARERVAFRLLFLALHFSHRQKDEIVIDLPLTYQDIADSINSTRDTVNRVMRQFTAEGIVSRSYRAIIIKKPQLLETMLNSETSLKS